MYYTTFKQSWGQHPQNTGYSEVIILSCFSKNPNMRICVTYFKRFYLKNYHTKYEHDCRILDFLSFILKIQMSDLKIFLKKKIIFNQEIWLFFRKYVLERNRDFRSKVECKKIILTFLRIVKFCMMEFSSIIETFRFFLWVCCGCVSNNVAAGSHFDWDFAYTHELQYE